MAVGGLGVLAALFLYVRGRRFLATALSAQGTVVDNVASSGGEGGIVYQPVIDFTTADGQQVRFTGSVASSPPKYQPGESVKVRYSPENPQKAKLPGIFGMWFLPLLFGVMGIGFLGGGIVWYLSDPGAASDETVSVPAQVVPSGIPTEFPASGLLLTVQDGTGTARPVPGTCDHIRESGKKREVQLSFEGGTLVLGMKPYTGPGAYQPGQTVAVGGSFFEGAEGSPTGAVVIDQTGAAGVVNLVSGAHIVSGPWDCSDLEVGS